MKTKTRDARTLQDVDSDLTEARLALKLAYSAPAVRVAKARLNELLDERNEIARESLGPLDAC